MGLKEFFGSVFSNGAEGVITGITDAADRFIHTPEEKAEFKLKVMNYEMEMKRLLMQGEQEYTKDRQNARAMYMKDSSLQKIFAIVFLVFYCLISGGMIAMVVAMAFFDQTVELPDWGVMLISSVFTAMSTKVATITDFLFGGSKKEDQTAKKISATFD